MNNTRKSDEIFISEFDDSSELRSDSGSESESELGSESSVHREQGVENPSYLFRNDALINDRYLLQRIIGRGEISIVWLARDLHAESGSTRRYVAIKVLNEGRKDHPDAAGALHRELELTSALTHPNIAAARSVERSGEDYFMTMEYLAGVTLDEAMQRSYEQGFSIDIAFEIFSCMSAGLAYAHSRRIVHADFRPSNIFMTREGQVKILGFRAAPTVDKLADRISDTATATAVAVTQMRFLGGFNSRINFLTVAVRSRGVKARAFRNASFCFWLNLAIPRGTSP
jgi:hypothetical protein